MTEEEWLAAGDPPAMFEFVRGKVSDRKLRLCVCAVCRTIDYRIGKEGLEAVEVGERFADGKIDLVDLVVADELFERRPPVRRGLMNQLIADTAGACLLTDLVDRVFAMSRIGVIANLYGGQVLLHDIFGNPFRPVIFDPRWRTETAVALAGGIYADRAFDRLPILADALEDAGCDAAELLAHLRGPGPHVRGCWAVDLVMGKE